MHPDSIPIPDGDGGELHLGPVTDKVKQLYCAWLRPRTILQAMAAVTEAQAENVAAVKAGEAPPFSDDDIKTLQVSAELAREKANAGGVAWSVDPSPAVAESLRTEAGTLKLARLMFAESVRGWSDASLYGWLKENGGEDTPYGVAFAAQWDFSDPNATRPAGTSAGLTGTSASTTS
jgi:hypothetical protein